MRIAFQVAVGVFAGMTLWSTASALLPTPAQAIFFEEPVSSAAGPASEGPCGLAEDRPCYMELVGLPMVRTACGEAGMPCRVEIGDTVSIEGEVGISYGSVSVIESVPIDVRADFLNPLYVTPR